MNVPTLGYEDDTQISKCKIARIQLVEAISLFLHGNFVCAITLAGAAESVYAGILEDEGTTSVIEDSVLAIQAIRENTSQNPFEGKPKNHIFNVWNTARNDLKHHGKGRDDIVTINLFDEAWLAIFGIDVPGLPVSRLAGPFIPSINRHDDSTLEQRLPER